MHRVTAQGSGCWRCIALLAYCDASDVIGSEAMQRNLYGRTDRRTTKCRAEQAV